MTDQTTIELASARYKCEAELWHIFPMMAAEAFTCFYIFFQQNLLSLFIFTILVHSALSITKFFNCSVFKPIYKLWPQTLFGKMSLCFVLAIVLAIQSKWLSAAYIFFYPPVIGLLVSVPGWLIIDGLFFKFGGVRPREWYIAYAMQADAQIAVLEMEKKFGPNSIECADSIACAAAVSSYLGNNDEAASQYRRAAAIRRSILGQDSPAVMDAEQELLNASLANFSAGIECFTYGNFRDALHLLRPYAEAGNTEAQCILGEIYRSDRLPPVDLKESVKWYQKAANQGDLQSPVQFGTLLQIR